MHEIATIHWLHGLLLDVGPSVKSRFQLAGVLSADETLVQICYVRCKSGHSTYIANRIPKDSLYTKVEPKHLHLISRVCHKTKLEYVKSIFLNDLIPGGDKSWNQRAHSNFTPFPPFDKRNIAAGRLGDEYNVVIVYSKEKLPKYDLMMSMSAVLVTDAQIPWSAIDLIYLVPSLKSGPAWVLYDPEHIGKTITGHNLPSHSGNAVVWSAKARESYTDIIDGSGIYRCRIQECPNCQSFNPDGFTSCLIRVV